FVTGSCFLLTLFFAPFVAAIPAQAFGPARKTGYKIFDRYSVTHVSGRTRILREFLVGFELPTKGL
ncbi:MAG TPA: hypothetical protein VF783_07000, partial [Terriglobales bacterium]